MKAFLFPLHPEQPAGRIRIDPGKKDGREWVIQDIPADAACGAAAAVAGCDIRFKHWEGSFLTA